MKYLWFCLLFLVYRCCIWPFEFDTYYFYVCSCSGKTHDDTLLAKLESIYTGSGDHGSTMVSLNSLLVTTTSRSIFLLTNSILFLYQFAFNMEQGLPVLPEWLFFNRVNARIRKGIHIGPSRFLFR